MPPTFQMARGFAARSPGFAALALSLVLGACADPSSTPVAGSLAMADPSGTTDIRRRLAGNVAPYAAAHRANPTDPAAALSYAGALRASGAKREALAVLDKVAASNPASRPLQLESGLLALDLGDPARAETLLRQAHDPKAPDWRLHSALGASLASRGKQQEAQAQFAKALALTPEHPAVLNNLALSYALDGKAAQAEKLLRRAQRAKARAPQVKQNLALVLGLNGKYDEARAVAETALPVAKANGNVAYLQRLAGARSVASRGRDSPDSAPEGAARPANASLPRPTYQLGGPAKAD